MTPIEQAQLASAKSALVAQLADRHPAEQVEAAFDAAVIDLDGAKVRTYLTVLVPRRARQALVDA